MNDRIIARDRRAISVTVASRTRYSVWPSGWHAVGTLSFAGALLVAVNGLYMLLVAFGNISDYPTNQGFVQHVLAMDTTNFGAPPGTGLDRDVMWRAVTNRAVQTAAYLGVIVWETATASSRRPGLAPLSVRA